MTRDRFEDMVAEAVAALPARFRDQLANVVFVIEDEPSDDDLRSLGLDPRRDTVFGLFDGMPFGEGCGDDSIDTPGRIVIYYRPLVRQFRTAWAIRREVRITVVHEVAHLFGLDETEVAGEGYA